MITSQKTPTPSDSAPITYNIPGGRGQFIECIQKGNDPTITISTAMRTLHYVLSIPSITYSFFIRSLGYNESTTIDDNPIVTRPTQRLVSNWLNISAATLGANSESKNESQSNKS